MQAAMSVTKCLTLLAMVLAIALGGHAISADTTNSSKEKQLVSFGSMPSSPSSVPDKGSKLRSLRTRDTTSAETAEEREVVSETAGLMKAWNWLEEALWGTRAYDYLPLPSESTNSLHTSLLDAKSEQAHEFPAVRRMISAEDHAKFVEGLPANQPQIWFDNGQIPYYVEWYLRNVFTSRSIEFKRQFSKLFMDRDILIREKFKDWHNNNLDSITSKLEKEFKTTKDATTYYEEEYSTYRSEQEAIARAAAREKASKELAAKEKQPDELVPVADRL